jgi:hypothetical protein
LLMRNGSHGGKVLPERKASGFGSQSVKSVYCSAVTFMKFLHRVNIFRSYFTVILTCEVFFFFFLFF